MASGPWFKLYAADYLLDAGVDSLPLDARAVLLSMWCLCHLEGSCPATPEEIARKTRLPLEPVAEYREELGSFFEMRDGRLYSHRMEQEKLKSAAAKSKADKRWHSGNANGNASSNAECVAQSQSQSQSEIQAPPPLEEFVLAHSKEKNYSQADFDARDLRRLSDARKEIQLKLDNGWGSELTNDQIFENQCALAGIPVEGALQLIERTKKWPQPQGLEASA